MPSVDPDAVRVQAAMLPPPCGPLNASRLRPPGRYFLPCAWMLWAAAAFAVAALFLALVLFMLSVR